MDKLEMKKELYIDLLRELGEIESESELVENFSYEKAFNKVVNYVNDQITSLEVVSELTGSTKKLTGKESYRDIVTAAQKLGVNYVGRTKLDLLREVNERIV